MNFIKNLYYRLLNKQVSSIYKDRFYKYHNTPKGVFWNNRMSQDLRLNIILDKITDNSPLNTFSIGDVGCGYGRLFDIIKERKLDNQIIYSGFDINKEMVLFCAGGVRSALAVKALKNMGYKKISHIEGGFGVISQSKFKIV